MVAENRHIPVSHRLIALLLLSVLIPAGYAAIPFTIFSCEPITNLQSTYYFNHGYTGGQYIGSCAGSTERMNNLEITAISGTGQSYVFNSAGSATMSGDTGSAWNVTIRYFGGAANGSQITHTTISSTNIGINGINFGNDPINITYYNSTAYFFNSTTAGLLINLSNNFTINMSSLNGQSLTLPLFNTTSLTEGFVAPLSASSIFTAPWRLTTESGGDLGSNGGFISKSWGPGLTNNATKPATGVFNATLLSPSNVLIQPSVSFYPSNSKSYVTMYNNSTSFVSVVNNSPSYEYDAVTQTWFFCPAYAAASFAPIYLITCYNLPPTSLFGGQTATLNQWHDINYTLTPAGGAYPNATTVTFTIASDGMLSYYGMQIINVSDNSTVFISQVNTSSSGGTLSYVLTENGTYAVNIFFKHQDFDPYTPLTEFIRIGGATGFWQAALDYQNSANKPFTPWTYYLIATCIALLAVSFASPFVQNGAGVAGLFVLWIATLADPSAPITCAGGYSGACVTPFLVTSFTTLAVISAIYLREYI